MSATVCAMCEKRERDCACERHCCVCIGQYEVHLCDDGMYYCPDCREACQVNLAKTE